MLYTASSLPFSEDLFRDPPACYRGAPFWSWNTLMTKDMIARQIPEFKRMGMGGFHPHVRVGLRNRYLSDEFMGLIRFCNEKAKENGMLCWLYDEDRYSSGVAGGEVTKTVAFRARWLKLTARPVGGMEKDLPSFLKKQERSEKAKGCFLTAYDIEFDRGRIVRSRQIGESDDARGEKRYLYLELASETPWRNGQTDADTMNPQAAAEFVRLTHEKYAQALGSDLGVSAPAIFTDEPHAYGLRLPAHAQGNEDVQLPFTAAMPEAFGAVDGRGLFESVPYIVWDSADGRPNAARYRYFRTLSELFSGAYCDTIGSWCKEHGVMFSGHLMSEDTVCGQADAVGEAMRCYRSFQIPGIDVLCDHRDFLAAKQAASVAHQYGKEAVLSELYGVTQWDFDFKGYKLAGDWQAALGVTLRVHHLAWASMNGESKRDYPAAIGWQSPWYRDFRTVEDHFARVNACMTRGRPVVRVAVVHPVESFWLLQGPADQCADRAAQLEEDVQSVTQWLLTGGIDFDFLSESLLEEDGRDGRPGRICCGEMEYEAVLVPPCITLRASTVERLLRFAKSGGRVFFAGSLPLYAGLRGDPRLEELKGLASRVGMSRQEVLDALGEWRELDILENGTKRTKDLLFGMREEDGARWVFIAQAFTGDEARQKETWWKRPLFSPRDVTVRLRGCWEIRRADTLTGDISPLPSSFRDGWTEVRLDMYGNDSLLLQAKAARRSEDPPLPPAARPAGAGEALTVPEPYAYETDEPNAFLLDRFEYALDGEGYRPAQEMLRLDNELRRRLGWPLRQEAQAQPYVRGETGRDHRLRLRARFTSDTALTGCLLALEEAGHARAALNGEPVDMAPVGYYVDPAIATVALPPVREGVNELTLEMDYGEGSDPEWLYILGDFGVELRGAHAKICPKPGALFWGDWTRQGFPFYTGNVTYRVSLPDGMLRGARTLQVPYYAGAAVKAQTERGAEKMLAFLPHACRLEDGEGRSIALTCLGNRYNGFGQLHMIGDDLFWMGPNAWRTRGTSWTDGYETKPMGILSAPIVIPE